MNQANSLGFVTEEIEHKPNPDRPEQNRLQKVQPPFILLKAFTEKAFRASRKIFCAF